MNNGQGLNGLTQTEKARSYNRLKRLLYLSELGLGAVYLLALLIYGWSWDLRDLAMQVGGGPVVWVLVYFVLLAIVFEILTLPLSIISGYYLEKYYGLLNQSAYAWTKDLIKSQLVGLFLGAAAIEILYLFLRWAGQWWWLPAGAAFALFFILLAQLTPVVILPIFFKFKRLPDNEFTRRLLGLCTRAEASVLGIYEWGLSTKTRRANAALVGWGPTRRVVLSDSLLSSFTPSEIEVVLAHELGHFRLNHLRWLLVIQILITFLAFILADLIFHWLGPFVGLTHLDDVAGLPLMILIFMAVSLVTLPAVNLVSRLMEKQADLFALTMTELTGSFISAMERLTIMNLGEMDPHPLIELLFHSHPSPVKRIQAAKEFRRNHTGTDHAVH